MGSLQEKALLRVEERARAKTDKLFLGTEVLGMDFVPEVHAELFDQYITYNPTLLWTNQSTKKNRLILWPRGFFKSSSLVVEIIQIILNFPDIRILIMQGTLNTTKRLLREILTHFTGGAPNSRLQELFPEFCGVKDDEGNYKFGMKSMQANSVQFVTPARSQRQLQQATVTVASPNSTKTGQHYDVGFFDDLVNEKNYLSRAQLEKVTEMFDMAQPLIDPSCYRFVTGTRYAHGDLYETIVRKDKEKRKPEWIVSIKTCWTDDGKNVRFPKQLNRRGTKEVGISREELLSIQSNNPGTFASQYLNQPASMASQVFTKDLLETALVDPIEDLSQAMLFVDLASGESKTADDSVILAAKTDRLGKLYVVDIVGGKWTPSQFALQVIQMVMKHRPLMSFFEKTASCKYFVANLEAVAGQMGIRFPLDYLPVNLTPNAKYIRIASLEGLIRSKRLFFFKNLSRWETLVEQFVKFPGGKHMHDDYPDTVALMAQHFSSTVPFIHPTTEAQRFMKLITTQGIELSQLLADKEQPPAENDFGDF